MKMLLTYGQAHCMHSHYSYVTQTVGMEKTCHVTLHPVALLGLCIAHLV